MTASLLLIVFDLLLVVLLTARLTRLLITDDLGRWYFRGPLEAALLRNATTSTGWRARLAAGLSCPFCLGFWVGVGVLAFVAAVGGPGHLPDWSRYVAGAFALNYLTAHIGARLGDAGYSDEDDQ